ncbi:MAG: peptidylprolyl isomerase [Proteobacteria bacterium]|nr:peptidylprolyl isomerase [Pseudomonadota bacterium]
MTVGLPVNAQAKRIGGKKMAELEKTKVIIQTEHGDIEIKFFPDIAPNHVNNFVKLAKEGFYNDTLFHRVIPGFMIQGGDPNTKTQDKRSYGQGGPGYSVDAEFSDKKHTRGILSMARSQNPNSAGSQFFIVVGDSFFLDGQYTVFGEVVSGMDVADKIVNLPRNSSDLPNDRTWMEMKVVVE